MKKKYGSGDIRRKRRQAELSFLCMILHTDLFYNPTKCHLNISNGFGVMLRNQIEEKIWIRVLSFVRKDNALIR